jgi:hypothetical protein
MGMDAALLRRDFDSRESDQRAADEAIEVVKDFEAFLKDRGKSFAESSVKEIRVFVSTMIRLGKNDFNRLFGLSRYCMLFGKYEMSECAASTLRTSVVIGRIAERIENIAGKEAKNKVFYQKKPPPVGSPEDAFPLFTQEIMDRLDRILAPDLRRKALLGDNHCTPPERFAEESRMYDEAPSVDAYLKTRRDRALAELESCLADGSPWRSRRVTARMVEYVKENLEILGGRREGNLIYLIMMPYDADAYLGESDPWQKRYLACRCPFVRSAILTGYPVISPDWCYCSAGREKMPFDVAFSEATEARIVETPLKGDLRCRFAIRIPDGKMK